MSKLMIKQIIGAIVALLSNVLEKCFKERYFPEPMKRVEVIPIHRMCQKERAGVLVA
jgi:hypothetical protein